MERPTRHALAFAAVLSIAACDKSDDAPADEQAGATDEAQSAGDENAPGGEEQEAADEAEEAEEGTYEPGAVGMRVVNTLDDSVDVYVRTTGRVQAFLVAEGLEAGAVSDWFFPPEGGNLVATTAGSGDATCFSRCEHFIAQIAPQPSEGNAHTVVLHTSRNEARGVAFWENPAEDQRGQSSNAMVAATADKGTFVVNSSGLTDARFGLLVGYAGVEGCQTPATTENKLIGGTGTPGFTVDGSVDILLYDNQDRDCAGDPVGGPFTVDVAAGERAHLILNGSPNDMSAIVLPMAGPDGPSH